MIVSKITTRTVGDMGTTPNGKSLSKLWRGAGFALIAGLIGCCVSLSAHTAGASYVLDYRFIGTTHIGFVDLLSASIVESDGTLVFTVTLYHPLSDKVKATYGFKVDLSDPPRTLALEASGSLSHGWTLSIGQFDDEGIAGRLPNVGSLPVAVFCDDCVTAEGSQVTFAIPSQVLGSPSSFAWFVYARVLDTCVDVLHDNGHVIPWPQGNPSDVCSAFQVEILPDRSEYVIGDEMRITLYVSEDAEIVVTDTAAGVVTPLFEGHVQKGQHSLGDLMDATLKAWYPTGVDTVNVIARTGSGCQQEATAHFTVSE